MSVTGHLPDLRFSLLNDLGQPVTAADFHGKRVMLYFGYTGCGAQCPLTLAQLVELSKDEPDVRVVFVTVTPALDRPQILHAYLRQFGANLTGLTGPTNGIEALARRYRAAFPAGSGPNLPHSNIVYVFDKAGRARLLIRPTDSDPAIRHDLGRLE
ncbi:MAG: SCO family protein [Asticcacaulis sp.]